MRSYHLSTLKPGIVSTTLLSDWLSAAGGARCEPGGRSRFGPVSASTNTKSELQDLRDVDVNVDLSLEVHAALYLH
jgi:hypothetical protein